MELYFHFPLFCLLAIISRDTFCQSSVKIKCFPFIHQKSVPKRMIVPLGSCWGAEPWAGLVTGEITLNANGEVYTGASGRWKVLRNCVIVTKGKGAGAAQGCHSPGVCQAGRVAGHCAALCLILGHVPPITGCTPTVGGCPDLQFINI